MKKILIWIIISFFIFSWTYAYLWESRDYLLETYGDEWKKYEILIDNFVEKHKDDREKLQTLQGKIVKLLWSYTFKNTKKSQKTKAIIYFLFEAVNDELAFWSLEDLEDGVYRQDHINNEGYLLYEVENGKLNGGYNTYDAEGNLTAIFTYKDNIPEWVANTFYEWWENIKSVANFVNGRVNGTWYSYYENGVIESENNYTDDILDGEQNHYLDDWTLIKRENLKMWVKHGKYQEWYNDWQIKIEDNSVDGKFLWKATQWYMNGQKKFESQYNENGKLHWKATSWYSNGQINIQDNWENWVLHGDKIIFNNSEATSATKQPYDYGILQVYDIRTVECTGAVCPPITIEDLYE